MATPGPSRLTEPTNALYLPDDPQPHSTLVPHDHDQIAGGTWLDDFQSQVQLALDSIDYELSEQDPWEVATDRSQDEIEWPAEETEPVEQNVEFLDELNLVTHAIEQMGRNVEPTEIPTAPPSESQKDQKKAGSSIGHRVISSFKKIWTKSVSHDRPAHECVACQDPIQDVEIRVPCGHYYDRECMVSLFEACTRDESLFHPRCCKKPIPFHTVRKHFSPDLRSLFLEKSREYRTTKRVYCSIPRCSLFLGAQAEGKGPLKVYKCRCGAATCARCKNTHHQGIKHSCSDNVDEGADVVLLLGKAEGWARCPGCRTMIELNMGCYHITCLCRAEFCYLCQERWKTCSCPQWDETRLMGAAEERIDIQLQLVEAAQRRAPVLGRWNRDLPPLPIANPNRPNREQLIQLVADELRVNHDCQHAGWRYRDGGGRCVGCHDVLDRYVFHCMDCHTIACNRCRLNRF